MKRLMIALLAASLVGCSEGTQEPAEQSGIREAEPAGAEDAGGQVREAVEAANSDGNQGQAEAPSRYVLSYTMNRIDGTPESLEKYKGKVVLIVNTASKCGLTPQYESLQTLYDAYRDEGLVVLGFPANQFNNQEPGSNEEIEQFCTENYGVSFPMFEKVVVKGEGTCGLYRQLAALSAEPSWNFTKYLVDREGNFVERIDPRTDVADPEVVKKIEALLRG